MYERDMQAQLKYLIAASCRYHFASPTQLLTERPEVFTRLCIEWRAAHPLEA